MLRLAVLLTLLCGGCTGPLVAALDKRDVASCIWWSTSPLTGTHGVTATGGVPLATCLAVPCPCMLQP